MVSAASLRGASELNSELVSDGVRSYGYRMAAQLERFASEALDSWKASLSLHGDRVPLEWPNISSGN